MNKTKKIRCHNCGAPTTSEICPYCKSATGIITDKANFEYPVIECKEGNIDYLNVVLPLLVSILNCYLGIMESIIFDDSIINIFFIMGIITFIYFMTPIIRNFRIKLFGKDIDAIVYGHIDGSFYINGVPTKIVKLLVNTNEGPRFILYELGATYIEYPINSKIKLRVYKNMFLIKKNRKKYF